MSTLQPLYERDRYTDEEWELAVAGRCSWNENVPGRRELHYCGWLADPDSAYRFCGTHDWAIREDYGADYGR